MRMQKIEDACTLHARIGWQGLTKAEYLDSGDYYLVTGVDFLDGVIDFQNCHYVAKDRYDQDSHIQLQKNDVLVTKDGTIGKVAIVDKFDKPATLNSGVFVVRPRNEEALLPTYLVYALRSGSFIRFIEQIKVGCTIAHLNQAKFLKFEIPDIGVEEQRKVVNILSRTEEILKKRRQQLEELDNLIKSRFVEMFGDKYTNNLNWDTKKLGDCMNFNNGKAHEQVVDENGEYILITSRAIASDLKDVRRTNAFLFPLHSNDIVMVMSDVPNGRALAKCLLIDSDEKYTLNQRICSFDKYDFNPVFLVNLLNRHQYFLDFNDGNGQTNLRKNDILECELIIPPIELQEQFETFVRQVDKLKFLFTISQRIYKEGGNRFGNKF